MLERISEMLKAVDGASPHFPPTVLYNENWMLRLVLDSLVRSPHEAGPVAVLPDVEWYSEALLPSAFLSRFRGDPHGESYTHADGVIGHFSIGGNGKGDLVLAEDARQFSVIEGKMFSGLSKGVKNAGFFDQAARNVACIARVLEGAERRPSEVPELSFHVVAPRAQIEKGVFGDLVTKESIRWKVERRVEVYEGEKDSWFEQWFIPTLDEISLGVISWEEIVAHLAQVLPEDGRRLAAFYERTVHFNSSPPPTVRW